jgi:hypothetical protein
MAGPREQKLIMEGSVCEDAHSYQDPNVKTIADARARGRVRCPNFNACVHGNDLDKRNTRCAAKFGQEVAKYALIDGTSIEVEMEAFKEEAFKSTLKGFIDPYIDHERIIIDEDEATAAVRHWANIVMLGEVATPDNELGERFKSIVANRDAESLRNLITLEYPTVLWGEYFKQLSDEDRTWAMQII